MRILHTSDWHIGHKIYERSRIDEHTGFLNWLLETIIEKKVDVLLVSGDVFDSSMPSGEATDLYYNFLHDLYTQTDASAVIIAGNHDSAVRLAAPKEFLKLADIHVTGTFRESPQECVVSITKNGETASFAAVPYLNEGDILSHVSLEGEVERNQRYREAIKKFYIECMSAMSQDSIRILMGHFFMSGGKIGDSERITTVGDTQPIRTGDLPEGADYIALGHLHRPQEVTGDGCPIIYSGSPIPMNFKDAANYLFNWDSILENDKKWLIKFLKSNFNLDGITTAKIEKNDNGKTIKISTDKNYILLKLNDEQTEVNLEIDDGRTDKFVVKIENSKLNIYTTKHDKKLFIIDIDSAKTCVINTIQVPVFKELVRVKGTLDEILTAASFGNWKNKYVEVRVCLEKPEVGIGDKIRKAFEDRGGRALVVQSFLPDMEDSESISASDIKSRSPAEIFQDFYNKKYGETSTDELDGILTTFNELIELVDTEGGF